MSRGKKQTVPPVERAGFRIDEWTAALGFSRPWFYGLEGEFKPKTIKLGDTTLIIETPRGYTERIAEYQQRTHKPPRPLNINPQEIESA